MAANPYKQVTNFKTPQLPTFTPTGNQVAKPQLPNPWKQVPDFRSPPNFSTLQNFKTPTNFRTTTPPPLTPPGYNTNLYGGMSAPRNPQLPTQQIAASNTQPSLPIAGQQAPSLNYIDVGTAGNNPQIQPQATLPEVLPNTSQLGDLEKQYASLLSMSPEEQAIQQRLNDLNTSTNLGLLQEENRTIAMPLITGRQEALMKQANIQSGTLQNRLALEQAKRQAGLEATKFSISRLDEARKAADELNKPISVGEGQSILQRQADGSYKSVYGGSGGDQMLSVDEATKLGVPYGTTKTQAMQMGKTPGAPNTELKTNALTSAQQLLQKFDSGQGVSAVGKSGFLGSFGYGLIPGTERANFVNQLNNLKSLLSLDNVKYLKGQGQVSDAERRLLEQAASKLNANQSEPEFRQTLLDIQTALSGTGSQGAPSANSPIGTKQVINGYTYQKVDGGWQLVQ